MYPWNTPEEELKATLKDDFALLNLMFMKSEMLNEKYINMLWRTIDRMEDYGKIKYDEDLSQHIKNLITKKEG